MNDFVKLITRMGIRRKYIFLLLLRSPFDAVRTWMLANLMKSVFSSLEAGQSDKLLIICVAYGLMCAMLFLYNGTVWSNYAAFSAKTEVRIQKAMFGKILSMPLRRIDSHFGGEWITRLNSDIQAAITMMNGPLNIPHVVVSVINTIISSILMFKSSFLLFGATWLLIIPQLLINHKIVIGALPRLKEESLNSLSESTSAIKPLIAEADTILLYDAGELMMKTCGEASRKLMKINMKMHVRSALGEVFMRLFGMGGYLVILFLGYRFLYNGVMDFSDVVYCSQVRGAILAGMLMFITCLNNLKINSVCIKRINETVEEQ